MTSNSESTNLENKLECKVCYTQKETFIDCSTCKQKLCTDCFKSITRLQCPYCKSSYRDEMPPPPVLQRQSAFYYRDGTIDIINDYKEELSENNETELFNIVNRFTDQYIRDNNIETRHMSEILRDARSRYNRYNNDAAILLFFDT